MNSNPGMSSEEVVFLEIDVTQQQQALDAADQEQARAAAAEQARQARIEADASAAAERIRQHLQRREDAIQIYEQAQQQQVEAQMAFFQDLSGALSGDAASLPDDSKEERPPVAPRNSGHRFNSAVSEPASPDVSSPLHTLSDSGENTEMTDVSRGHGISFISGMNGGQVDVMVRQLTSFDEKDPTDLTATTNNERVFGVNQSSPSPAPR